MIYTIEAILVVLLIRATISLLFGFIQYRQNDDKLLIAQPLVSVVIPAFNEQENIGDTLRFLLACDYLNKEIIVVDDGSTDATPDIVASHRSNFLSFRSVRLPRNSGKATALNIGVRLARGELVLTLDADTEVTKNAIRNAVAKLQYSEADAVSCVILAKTPQNFLEKLQEQEYIAVLNFERAAQSVVSAVSVLPGAATIFRRKLVYQRKFSSRTRTEDADLTLGLGACGVPMGFARQSVVYTRVPGSASALVQQRIRWNEGHWQCSALHVASAINNSKHFAFVTYCNFVIIMLSAPLVLFIAIWWSLNDEIRLIGISWSDGIYVGLILTYLQRSLALLSFGRNNCSVIAFVLEPLVMAWINAASLIVLCARLAVRLVNGVYDAFSAFGSPRVSSRGRAYRNASRISGRR